MKELEAILPAQFRKLERESDRELYLSTRVVRGDWETKFPWYVTHYRDTLEESLTKAGLDIKVTLGRNLEAIYLLVQYPSGTAITALYMAYLSHLENEELGKPIERRITTVGRPDKHGATVKKARLVIEGFQLEELGLGIGDLCDLYIVPSTSERVGFMRIIPQKRLK